MFAASPVWSRATYAAALLVLLAAQPALAAGAGMCAAFFGTPFFVDPDLDLPASPSIEQQLAAAKKEMERFKDGDQTLDGNYDLVVYFNDLAKRLIAAQDVNPPYPIVVHVSTGPELNAYGMIGGNILIYSRIFEVADNEAQLVAILGHELSHEIHNDYAFFWTAAKNQQDSYGRNGLLEKSREIEQRADLDATRMMYGAGWDPAEQIKMMTRMAKRSQTERDSHRIFYSTHPDDPERIEAIKKTVGALPPKQGLTTDSQKFQDLKKTL